MDIIPLFKQIFFCFLIFNGNLNIFAKNEETKLENLEAIHDP